METTKPEETTGPQPILLTRAEVTDMLRTNMYSALDCRRGATEDFADYKVRMRYGTKFVRSWLKGRPVTTTNPKERIANEAKY